MSTKKVSIFGSTSEKEMPAIDNMVAGTDEVDNLDDEYIADNDMNAEDLARLDNLRNNVYNKMLEMLNDYDMCHLTCMTGFGKTVIFRRYAEENIRECILYITDRKDSVTRMQAHLSRYNSGSKAYTYAYFARKKTLGEKMSELSNYTTVIFDESHLMGAHNCDRVVEYAKKNKINLIGGSATSKRTDGVDVAQEYFRGHIIEYTPKDALEDKFLEEPVLFSTVYIGLRIQEMKAKLTERKDSKWAISQLTTIERAIAKRDTLKSSIQRALEVGGAGLWIVFHPNIEVLNLMAPIINDAFISEKEMPRYFSVSSDKEHLNVSEFIEQHKGFSVVHAVDMMTTGWHFDDISGLVINSMTDSLIKAVQQAGRAIVLGSKKKMVIVDIIGRYTSKKGKFIEETFQFSDGMGGKAKRDLQQFDVDTEELDMSYGNILDIIDSWMKVDTYRLTVEEAVKLVRKYKYKLGSASIATGVPEDILKKML